MFGFKKSKFLLMGIVLATQVAFGADIAPDGSVYNYSDFERNVNAGVENITFYKNVNATFSGFPEFETSNLTVIDGNGYDLFGNDYSGFLNTGNLQIKNFGTYSENTYSAGITGFTGYASGGQPDMLLSAGPSYNEYGGAFSNIGGTLEIVDTIISDNGAGYGGAIYNDYDGYLSLENVTFDSNMAQVGSAIFNGADGTINYISNSTFKDNVSEQGGTIINLGKIGDIPALYLRAINQMIWVKCLVA